MDMESIVNKKTQIRVAVVWNDSVYSETLLDPSKGVVLGTSKKADLCAPVGALLATDAYQLFASGGMGAQLQLHGNMTGWIEQSGARRHFENEMGMHTLQDGDRGLVNVNDHLAVFFYVTSATQQTFATPLLAALESRFFSALLFAMILHFGVLITAFAYKDYQAFVNVQIDDRFTEVLTQKNEEVEVEDMEEEEEEDVGKQAGGEEGKFGKEDKLDKSKVPTTDGELVDKIKNVGLAKALSSSLMGRGALSSVFGNKDGFSDQLNAAMSGGDGELVMGHGAGGMGLRGTGSGGGGSGFGRIHGMGKIDTGGGRGTRASLGGRGKAKKKFRVRRGKPSVGNFCKQADILRVVNSRQRGIQYCYEKELARNPELGGKVSLNWNIGLDGSVLKVWVGSSTLKNGTVESCMTRSVKRWKFTKPDGGICQIKFPFVFNSGF
jgi:hypothetical protein